MLLFQYFIAFKYSTPKISFEAREISFPSISLKVLECAVGYESPFERFSFIIFLNSSVSSI